MIPVVQQREPEDFDEKVRRPGNEYLQQHPDVKASKLPDYWTSMSENLWKVYGGICAYLAIFFDSAIGSTIDHFIPKSRNKQMAYEWSNYRLASWGMNRKKARKNVLDPFALRPDSFRINFSNGEICPNPAQDAGYQERCRDTIRALGLNESRNKEMRIRHFDEYFRNDVSLEYLEKNSPFVHSEVVRQNLQR